MKGKVDRPTMGRNRQRNDTRKQQESIQNIEIVTQDTTASGDKGGNLLKESSEVLNRLAEYCKELYNFTIQPDLCILARAIRPPQEPSPLPIMREEVEVATQSLPADKSLGSDNIPAKFLKQGEKELVILMITFCQKICETIKWSEDFGPNR